MGVLAEHRLLVGVQADTCNAHGTVGDAQQSRFPLLPPVQNGVQLVDVAKVFAETIAPVGALGRALLRQRRTRPAGVKMVVPILVSSSAFDLASTQRIFADVRRPPPPPPPTAPFISIHSSFRFK